MSQGVPAPPRFSWELGPPQTLITFMLHGEAGEQLEQPQGVRGGTTQAPTLLPHLRPHDIGLHRGRQRPLRRPTEAHHDGNHLQDPLPPPPWMEAPSKTSRANEFPSTTLNTGKHNGSEGHQPRRGGAGGVPIVTPPSQSLSQPLPFAGVHVVTPRTCLDSALLVVRSNSFQMCAVATSCPHWLYLRYVFYF